MAVRFPGFPTLMIATLAFGSAACDRSETHEDLGQACLGEPQPWDTGTVLVIGADDAAPVTVIFSTCSSGSTDWSEQSCEVDLSAGRITVTTSVKTHTPKTATADCTWVDWDCGTVDLPAGDYSLVYGGSKVEFSVPYDGSPICVEN